MDEVTHVRLPLRGPRPRHCPQSTWPEPIKGYDGRTVNVRHLMVIL